MGVSGASSIQLEIDAQQFYLTQPENDEDRSMKRRAAVGAADERDDAAQSSAFCHKPLTTSIGIKTFSFVLK